MKLDPKSVIPPSPSREDYQNERDKDTSWLRADEPISLFETWLSEAVVTEPNDPHAMSLATVDAAGRPDVRMVLLKGVDSRGFVFYTNGQSTKGQQLELSGQAALCFHWKSQRRQVRVRGAVDIVSEAESDAYFKSRARGSQIGAWASQQSRPVASREAMMAATAAIDSKYKDKDVPRPKHWYGWRVKPETVEFWQDGAFRLHDRLVFINNDGAWDTMRLFP